MKRNLFASQTRMSKVLLATMGIFVFVFGCQREKDNNSEHLGPETEYVTPVFPIVSDNDIINDHKRFIALGMAELLNNPSMANLSTSKSNIENYLGASTSKDVAVFKHLVHMQNNAYDVPASGTNNELGDAINYAVNTSYTENGVIVNLHGHTWNWDMLEGYIDNSVTFNSYIQIPDYQSLTPTQKSKPIVVVPKITDVDDELLFPITAYKWDLLQNKIVQHTIQDEDEIYDQNSTYYFWFVDYGEVQQPTASSTKSCVGDFAPLCPDDYCDEECGEDESNCTDCSSDKNKKLKIKKYAVLRDNRVRNICTSGPGEKYRYMVGNYKIAYGCIIDQPNGHQSWHRGSFACTPLKRSSVHTCRTKLNCSQHCDNGGATWSQDYPTSLNSAGTNCDVPILDEHFNPKKSVIYIYFYTDNYNKLQIGRAHV